MNNEYLHPKNKPCFSNQLKNYALFFLIFTISAFSVSAQNYTLTSNGDTHAATPASSPLDAGGQITLRSAMEASTQIAGTHIITIPGSITTINLTQGQMTVGNAAVGNNITVNGPGKTVLTVNQTTLARVFSTGLGAVTFSLNDLKLNYTGPAGSFTGGGGAIVAGGTNASTSLTNVAITNFGIQVANGGAISCTSGSTANPLTVTNCDFSNNYCGGLGGAIYYTGSTTCTITGCTFTSNQTGPLGINSGGSGGAIATSGPPAGGSTCTITKCTFTNNKTLNNTSGIGGGAITNAFGISTVNYCRFVGNTAAFAGNGNTIYESGAGTAGFENIIADNNWWGVNTGPTTSPVGAVDYFSASGGVVTVTKWLQLKSSASPTSICTGSTSTVTASFLSNSASEAISAANLTTVIGLPVSFVSPVLGTLSGAQTTIQAAGTATVTYTAGGTAGAGSVNATVDNVPAGDATAQAATTVVAAPSVSGGPAASTSCVGLPVSFSATVTNQTGITWQESANAGFSSPTTLTTTGIYSGTSTNTLTISDNTSVNGKYYRLIATNGNGCGSTTSAGALLTATTPTLSGNNSVVQTVGTANNIYYAASCGVVCKVVPSGASPVTGSVTSQVWVEPSVPTGYTQPFVQRHYQITPGTSPLTATATVTLYFSQTEFDNFNAAPGSILNLPTGSGDAAGKANLRIAKYAGSSGNGSGMPNSYSSGAVVLDPPDANIVWNATYSRWEVSVDVTGFSGFIVQTSTVVLPIKLISFTAQYSNNAAKVKWEIAQPEDGSVYELQRSANASSFTTINTQTGDLSKIQFNYTDPITVPGKWYYRLQMTDRNGKVTYSDIIFVKAGSNVQEITIYPNPVKAGEDIKVNLQNIIASKIELSTVAGQQLWSAKNNITGSYSIHLPFVIAKGAYLVKIYTSESVETRKIMIE